MSRAPFSSPVKQASRPRSAPGAPRRPGALSRRYDDEVALQGLESSLEAVSFGEEEKFELTTVDAVVSVYGVDSATQKILCGKNESNALEPFDVTGIWNKLTWNVRHLTGPEIDQANPQYNQATGEVWPQEGCNGTLYASYSPNYDQYMTCKCRLVQVFIDEAKKQ